MMKPLANLSHRPIRLMTTALFGLLVSSLALPCLAQQDTEKLPFDVFNQPIDNARIYMYLERNAGVQKARQAENAAEVIQQQLESINRSSDVNLDSLIRQSLDKPEDLYQHMVKSCLYLGMFYDCGKCDRSHVSLSGGVVISETGLALTNYHVLQAKSDGGTTEGFIAMTHDGKCFEVEKVLAADQVTDIALVQLKANGHKFYAAPLAKTRPTPMTNVNLVSHPSGEFYVLTTGKVSRYSKVRGRRGQSINPNAAFMEITADFGGGSSGCGVFNDTGEIIGVVSRLRALKRSASKMTRNGKEVTQPAYVEMLIRRCSDLDAIKACFAQPDSNSNSDSPTTSAQEPEPVKMAE